MKKKVMLFVFLLAGVLMVSQTVLSSEVKDTFRACGKSWKVGAYGLSWNEAKAWINNLDSGWSAPSQSEVYELWKEIGSTHPLIARHWVWADGSKTVGFGEGQRSGGNPNVRGNCVVIAVGPKYLTDGQQ